MARHPVQPATDRYVTADGQLDIAAIRRDHPPRGWCPICEEQGPCGPSWAAQRLARFRAKARTVDVDRAMGITSLVCAVFIVGSWLVNPATLPW